jgi:hypothetical protein
MLARRRWKCSKTEWNALPDDERLERIAFEHHIQNQMNTLMTTLAEAKHNTPEVVTLIYLARMGALG